MYKYTDKVKIVIILHIAYLMFLLFLFVVARGTMIFSFSRLKKKKLKHLFFFYYYFSFLFFLLIKKIKMVTMDNCTPKRSHSLAHHKEYTRKMGIESQQVLLTQQPTTSVSTTLPKSGPVIHPYPIRLVRSSSLSHQSQKVYIYMYIYKV